MSAPSPTLCSLLERRGQAAAVAMVTRATLREAAAACGVSVPTLVRWSRQPRFQRMLDSARDELCRQLVAAGIESEAD
jgi:hypothetical protein